MDPGGWNVIAPSKLIMPIDTHIHRISLMLGLTNRKSADLKTALEISDFLGLCSLTDPVKFDFPLSRLGIRHTYYITWLTS